MEQTAQDRRDERDGMIAHDDMVKALHDEHDAMTLEKAEHHHEENYIDNFLKKFNNVN